MPQLAPINWLMIFITLILIIILINSLSFFKFKINKPNNIMKTNKNFNNWKW
nr:ATP synthase F0 subunit 8 [Thlaspida biramosa]